MGWAGLWNKRFEPIMSNFWGRFFQLFVGEKNNIVASAVKSCIEKRLKKFGGMSFFFRKNIFLGLKMLGREQTTVGYTVMENAFTDLSNEKISFQPIEWSYKLREGY